MPPASISCTTTAAGTSPSRQSEKPLVQPAIIVRSGSTEVLAERERFELSIPFRVCPLSRRIVSTTHAPLRAKLQSPRRNDAGDRASAARLKKFLQQRAASICHQARGDFHLMIQLGMIHHVH